MTGVLRGDAGGCVIGCSGEREGCRTSASSAHGQSSVAMAARLRWETAEAAEDVCVKKDPPDVMEAICSNGTDSEGCLEISD